MKVRIPFLAFVVASTLGGSALAVEEPVATSNSPEAEAALYSQSVTLPRQASACAERIADYMPRFQRFYDAWRAENATRIVNGGKFLRQQAASADAKLNADDGLAKLADQDVERLRKTSIEKLVKHCDLMLESLAPPAAN
jgi:hypothetical protein